MTADPVADSPVSITIEMVTKAMIKMKNGKAAGPSEIDTEILRASSDTGVPLVADLTNYMIRNGGTIPSDWKNSFLINIYEWKGDALIEGNYRGLKLLDHVMKGIERVITKERVFIIDMQLASCLNGEQLTQNSSSDSCKKNIWLRKGNCTSFFLTLKRHSIEYQEKSFGALYENVAWRNRLCS